jgi:sterol desaturase/sphingolipid hydroxylase (fatty acid hydroxylase superfamily)
MDIAHSLVNFPIFFLTWLTFFAVAIISFLIQMNYNRGTVGLVEFIRHCFPFESWTTKSALMDVKIYLLGKLLDKTYSWIAPLCTVVVSTYVGAMLASIFPDHTSIQPTYIIIIFCSLVLFLVVEFSNYVTHYLQHRVPFLWEIHKVHHSATFLNPLTAKRGHPLGFMIDGITSGILAGLPAGIFVYLFSFGLPDIVFLYACASRVGTIATLDSLKHSHFPITLGWFDKVLISPHMHQIHHSAHPEHWDKNFGINLSIWDWVFGTAYRPRKGEDIVYGLGNSENADYERLSGVYVGPLLKMWRLIAPNRGAAEPDASKHGFVPGQNRNADTETLAIPTEA